MFKAEMKKLAILAEISSMHGHAVVESTKDYKGNCGNVKYGIDTLGSYLKVYDKSLTQAEAKILIADLLNALGQISYMEWKKQREEND